MCILFGSVLVLSLAMLSWVVRAGEKDSSGFSPLIPTMVGVGLSLSSFASLPWIRLTPLDYLIDVEPELFEELIPDAIAWLLRLLGNGRLTGVLEFLESVGGLPAWSVLILPTMDWMVRGAIGLLVLTSVGSLLWIPVAVSARPGLAFRRIAGWMRVAGASLSLTMLLYKMPMLDSLGAESRLTLRFLTIMAGAKMSRFVWLAWFGLVMLLIGGLLEVTGATPVQRYSDERTGRSIQA